MRDPRHPFANGWYAHLAPDADDGPGGLFADLAAEEPPMEPKQRAERREWLARREAPLPELATQD